MNGNETDVEKALAFLQDRGVRVERGSV